MNTSMPGEPVRVRARTVRRRIHRRVLCALVMVWSATPAGAEEGPQAGLPVGAPMADFGLRRLDFATGELADMVWLSDYVGARPEAARPEAPRKGEPRGDAGRARLVLLNFYATWCKPCQAELPELARMQRRYGAAGLQVLSVNFRTDTEPLSAAVSGTRRAMAGEPPYPVLFDRFTNRNQLLYLGQRGTLPCNILIDGSGVIRGRFQGGDRSDLAALEAAVVEHLQPKQGATP